MPIILEYCGTKLAELAARLSHGSSDAEEGKLLCPLQGVPRESENKEAMQEMLGQLV